MHDEHVVALQNFQGRSNRLPQSWQTASYELPYEKDPPQCGHVCDINIDSESGGPAHLTVPLLSRIWMEPSVLVSYTRVQSSGNTSRMSCNTVSRFFSMPYGTSQAVRNQFRAHRSGCIAYAGTVFETQDLL